MSMVYVVYSFASESTRFYLSEVGCIRIGKAIMGVLVRCESETPASQSLWYDMKWSGCHLWIHQASSRSIHVRQNPIMSFYRQLVLIILVTINTESHPHTPHVPTVLSWRSFQIWFGVDVKRCLGWLNRNHAHFEWTLLILKKIPAFQFSSFNFVCW